MPTSIKNNNSKSHAPTLSCFFGNEDEKNNNESNNNNNKIDSNDFLSNDGNGGSSRDGSTNVAPKQICKIALRMCYFGILICKIVYQGGSIPM